MTVQRYPRVILRNDYVRAAVGVAVCVPLAAVSRGSSFGFWLFVGLTLLFAVFGARTWLRGRAEYRLTEAGLLRTNAALKGQAATGIAWSELTGLTLRFFSVAPRQIRGVDAIDRPDSGRTPVPGFDA